MSQAPGITSVERRSTPTAFWAWTGAGALVMAAAWFWFGLSVSEEASEQGKAEAAGTTMAGFAATVGGVPLVLAHIVGLVLLSVTGWRAWRGAGLVYAALAVAAASLVGFGIGQLFFGGNLFYTAPVFAP